METLIALGAALVVYLLIMSRMPKSGKDVVDARVTKYLSVNEFANIQDQVLRERAEKEGKLKFGREFVSAEFADVIAASGIKLKPSEFLWGWLAITLLPILLFRIINGNMVSAAVAGMIGLAIPPFLLVRSRKKRQDLFVAQLSEALMIIGNSLKGGFSMQQAMDSVAKEMAPPLSDEFSKTMREIRYGLPVEDALRHMAERNKNQDLDLFVSAVLTSSKVGSNLSEILDTISSTIKDRIRIRQEVKVLTATGRISGYVVGLLPVGLILVLMLINPNYFGDFVDTGIGKMMVGVGILMEVTGFWIISKITDVEY